MKRSTSKTPLLRDLLEPYNQTLRQRGLVPETLASYNRGLKNFLDFFEIQGGRFITDIRPEHLTAFLIWVKERCRQQRALRVGRTPGASFGEFAANRYARVACRWCEWLYQTDRLLVDPGAGFPERKRAQRFPRVLTYQEIDELLGVIEGEDPKSLRDQAILDLLYSSGLRVGELCDLNLEDVDLVECEVFVKRSKSGRSRRVPMGDPARTALKRYLERGRGELCGVRKQARSRALFLSVRGRPLQKDMVHHWVVHWASVAGIHDRVTPHALRHTAAAHLLKGGASVVHVQAFLGHRSLESTQHYTRLVIDDLKQAHARCHPREAGQV